MNFASLVRTAQSEYGTFGTLFFNGIPFCVTLEPPVGTNKIGRATPIPLDSYTCIPHNSPAHPHCWEISNVPGHDNVLFHVGNIAADTEDCVLVGQSFAPTGVKGSPAGILNSDLALNAMRACFPSTFPLEIVSAMQTFAPTK